MLRELSCADFNVSNAGVFLVFQLGVSKICREKSRIRTRQEEEGLSELKSPTRMIWFLLKEGKTVTHTDW